MCIVRFKEQHSNTQVLKGVEVIDVEIFTFCLEDNIQSFVVCLCTLESFSDESN